MGTIFWDTQNGNGNYILGRREYILSLLFAKTQISDLRVFDTVPGTEPQKDFCENRLDFTTQFKPPLLECHLVFQHILHYLKCFEQCTLVHKRSGGSSSLGNSIRFSFQKLKIDKAKVISTTNNYVEIFPFMQQERGNT